MLAGGGETGDFKNLGGVIHDDRHAGELLHKLQQNAQVGGAAEVRIVAKQLPASLLHLQAFTDLVEFVASLGIRIA
ncbi:hypothetical protein D3C78_1826090 [compost metagenome]